MRVPIFLTLLAATSAFANFQVYPTRVVLNDKSRVSQVTLTQTGAEETTYEIVPVFYRQDAKGRMSPTEGKAAVSAAGSAAEFLRYSPRVFSLKQGQTQILKIRASPKASLADGIYRIHLRVQPAPEAKSPLPIENTPKSGGKKGATSLELKAVLSIAIPVYFSHGSIKRSLDVSDLAIDDDGKKVSFLLKQDGNGFVFGDINVSVAQANKETPYREIGHLFNMASYAPERRVEIVLADPIKKSPKAPEFRIQITQSPDDGGELIFSKQIAAAPAQ
ncbi:MAG: hypothetical protein ABIR96_12990 [Bdellovibrionota bacterium]